MLVFLLLMNASGFAIMLLDKNLARRRRRRVPEALLLAFAAGLSYIKYKIKTLLKNAAEKKG